jgi:MFS family permease
VADTSLWRHRDFMLLWGGQTVSEMGSAVTQLALPLTAVVLLDATTLQVGLLNAAATLAFAVIALPAGALVDRMLKRRVMIVCDTARLVIVASVPVAWAAGVLTMGQLYAVAITTGVFTVFFDVSYQSYLPALVRSEHLMNANGRLGASQSFAQLAGPGLGGGLVGAFGAPGAMTADALSYLASVGSLLGIRGREERPAATAGKRPSLRADIAEGVRFVVGHPILRKIVACTGTANLFSSISGAVQILFLIRVLHVPPAYTGLLFAISAVGGVAGGVFSGPIARRVGSARIIWFSMLVLAVPGILPPLAEPGWGVVLYPVGFGFVLFAGVLYNVAQVSYRQAVCPPRLMGRMNAAVRWIVWGTMPLGGVIGGVLGTAIGIRPTLWIAFIGSWAAGLWVYFSPLRRMRDIPVTSTVSEPAGEGRTPGE